MTEKTQVYTGMGMQRETLCEAACSWLGIYSLGRGNYLLQVLAEVTSQVRSICTAQGPSGHSKRRPDMEVGIQLGIPLPTIIFNLPAWG